MTTSREQRFLPADGRDDVVAWLERENAQLRRAVDSHAMVDQAIGVLAAVCRLEPGAGFEVLREVSQRTNITLHTVADAVLDWALERKPLPVSVDGDLQAAL
ncbi:ANTAR domain-containing protein, partial [Streptomyces sp. NPDC056628]|uniref:ANTAR domain-containing protein n=1 Tax=Streptomyces sp. NPDC056628 TaxID=3345882 RepID=UPI0036CC88F5